MTLDNILLPSARFIPLFEGEGAGGGGGGQESAQQTPEGGKPEGQGLGKDQPTGIGEAGDQGDGGTAKGQDNPGGEGDGKPGESQGEPPKDGETKEDGEGEGDAQVPETYEINAPEGLELDQGLADAITPVFKDLGLTQEQADKLVGAYGEAIKAQSEATAAAVTEMVTGWRDTAKADKEIGGGNWQASVDAANSVIRQFGTPETVSELMVSQGVGNHPEMIRLLARIGKAVGDDSLETGQTTDTGKTVSQEEAWYGGTTPTSKRG